MRYPSNAMSTKGELPPEGIPSEEIPPDRPTSAPKEPPLFGLRVLAFISGFVGLIILIILWMASR